MRKKTKPSCPSCKSKKVIPVIYGLPGNELMKEAEEGKVALGGCVINGNESMWHCIECGDEW